MLKNLLPYFYGFLIALGGALIAQYLNSPLPWLIGPLLATAITSMLNFKTKSHNYVRCTGQWVIGASLGLYFTPHTVQAIISYWPYIALGCFFALGLSLFNALALRRWGRVDFKTAWFAGAVGGASEMANLAEKHKAQVDSVASSHSVRVLVVVILIPFTYKFLGVQGDILSPAATAYYFSFIGFIALISLTLCGVALFKRFNITNPWVLGPLLITLLLTSNQLHLSHLPPVVQSLGQLCIGWALGSKYGPDFFSRAPRYLTVSAIVSVLGLGLSALFAYSMAQFVDIPFSTLVLGLSPGGIAEMTITAKVLSLGVPTVAAFHVARMIFILLTAQTCYKWLGARFSS